MKTTMSRTSNHHIGFMAFIALLLALAVWQPPQAAAVSCAAPQFGPANNFAIGTSAQSGAQGDFDGNGVLDLVTPNSSSGNVSVLLGFGNGTFGVQTLFDVGLTPESIAVGDLNNDGAPDLVVGTIGDVSISVLLNMNDGSGGFAPQTFFVNGAQTESVALADFDGDGNLDLVVADQGRVRLGNGNGTFGAFYDVASGFGADFVAVGDLDGDGAPDLVLADDLNFITTVLNQDDGLGSFEAPYTFAAGNEPSAVALGKFNADGNLDMALANEQGDNVTVLLGNGDGTFGSEVPYVVGGQPNHVAAGEVNGDGILDLISSNEGDATISVLLGNGDGTFGPQTTFNVGPKTAFVLVGDYNGDGAVDLGVGSEDAGIISVLLNGCVIHEADLLIAKAVASGTAKPGQTLTYTIVVNNTGPFSASQVQVTDAVPQGTTFLGATTSQGSFTAPPVGFAGTVTYNLGGLANGASATMTLTVKVSLKGNTLIVNTAKVTSSSATTDPNEDNNTVTITTKRKTK